MTPKPQAGKAQRTLTPVLVERLLTQARAVAMLRTALDVQSNRIGIYEDSRRAKAQNRRACRITQVVRSAAIVAGLLLAFAGRASADPPSPLTFAPTDPPPRPALLLPLYASYVGLQVTDGYLTWTAVHHGAVEQNVIVKPIAGNAPGLLGVKVGISVATILLMERLRHDHPRAAVWMMVALNSGASWVVWRNRQWLP
jgi:hypothetical protein